jgi:hypothetical protein
MSAQLAVVGSRDRRIAQIVLSLARERRRGVRPSSLTGAGASRESLTDFVAGMAAAEKPLVFTGFRV